MKPRFRKRQNVRRLRQWRRDLVHFAGCTYRRKYDITAGCITEHAVDAVAELAAQDSPAIHIPRSLRAEFEASLSRKLAEMRLGVRDVRIDNLEPFGSIGAFAKTTLLGDES